MIVTYVWTAVTWVLAASSFAAPIWIFATAMRKIRSLISSRNLSDLDRRTWLLAYAGVAFVTVVVVSCLTPITYNHWHLLIVFPFTLIPLFYFLLDYRQRHPGRGATILLLAAVYFIVVTIFSSIDSRRHSYQSDPARQIRA